MMADHPPAYQIERFFATRRVRALTPSPDGSRLLFASDMSGQFNLWAIDPTGGWPRQLTLFDQDSVREAAWSPRGEQIAFTADDSGTERFQVYLMDAVGGWPRRITHLDGVQHTLAESPFSPDGRTLAYGANANHPRTVDIHLYDLESGEVRVIPGPGGLLNLGAFSPDGQYLLATQILGNTDQDIWLIHLASGERRNLTAHTGRKAKFVAQGWAADTSGFYLLTNDGREFDGLAFYDLAKGEWAYRLAEDWDIEMTALSGDGSLLACIINEAGRSRLKVVEVGTGRERPLPSLPTGVVASISFAGPENRLFLLLSTHASPNEIHRLDLRTGQRVQLTQSMLGNIPPERFVAPELVHVESFDGRMVPAWLYRPHGIKPGERVPVVMAIHGGSQAQERPNYHYAGGFYQYLLSQSIAILAPNIRGSGGFGSTYQNLLLRDWGGGGLRDVEACNQYLRRLDWIDPDRIGIWGGSFGGFMTLSAATRLPDLWAAACDYCGPSNLLTFTHSMPPQWRPMIKEWIGDPEEDRELLLERSPITYADQLQCPLMIVQGAQDPRVVKAESDQMVERLRSLGREVEYLVFEDEGHGFAKKENQLKGYRSMADFLIRHLKG